MLPRWLALTYSLYALQLAVLHHVYFNPPYNTAPPFQTAGPVFVRTAKRLPENLWPIGERYRGLINIVIFETDGRRHSPHRKATKPVYLVLNIGHGLQAAGGFAAEGNALFFDLCAV